MSKESNNKRFIEKIESVSDLNFQELQKLIGDCSWELTQAYGLLGRESQFNAALKLSKLHRKLSEFAKNSIFYSLKKNKK